MDANLNIYLHFPTYLVCAIRLLCFLYCYLQDALCYQTPSSLLQTHWNESRMLVEADNFTRHERAIGGPGGGGEAHLLTNPKIPL